MGVYPVCVVVCLFLLLTGGAAPLQAQWYAPPPAIPVMTAPPLGGAVAPGHYYGLVFKKFVNSFTSYQFPNPFPPGQDPLSRLEFPLDHWFIGLSSGYVYSGWSLQSHVWINLNEEATQLMQDSDWDDETNPSQKTIFSESRCRLNRGVLVDIRLNMPSLSSGTWRLGPILGWRYQFFSFTTHDGYQTMLGGAAMSLPGDGIAFKQRYNHFYAGLSVGTTFTLNSTMGEGSRVELNLQGDFAPVNAKNEDLHLLRAGNRVTEEQTSGHCWHLAAMATVALSQRFSTRFEVDFKRLLTNGSHRLTNELFFIDFSFSGAKVWSDQMSISACAQWRF